MKEVRMFKIKMLYSFGCSGRIFYETAVGIWLKFCTVTEACLKHCVCNFGSDHYRGPAPRPPGEPNKDVNKMLSLAVVVTLLHISTVYR